MPHVRPPATDPASGDDAVVRLAGVHKSFGDSPALVDLGLEVPSGRITVLLGPNGAGKTTAIRMITGAFSPDAGAVRTLGLDPGGDAGNAVRARCGVVSAKPALYDRLSGRDNLRYAAELHGLGRGPTVEARIEVCARRFGIAASLEQQVGAYSTGMKTRLALARSILHAPELLLYDEPTSGLDPESSHAVLELIREMTGDGTTVVMCTHLLLEAEGLADHVVVLQDGTAVASGRPDQLVHSIWPDVVVRIGVADEGALSELDAAPGVLSWERARPNGTPRGAGVADAVAEVVLDEAGRVPDVVAHLAATGARLTRVEPVERTLEDLYFAVRAAHGASRLGDLEPDAGDLGSGPPEEGR